MKKTETTNSLTKTKISLDLNSEVLAIIQHISRENHRSFSGEVNYILEQYTKNYIANTTQQLSKKKK